MFPPQYVAAGVAAAAGAASIAAFFMKKDPVFPSDLVSDMVRNRRGKDVQFSKMVIIVTGSTNGLGKMIASQLYGMGAKVIIASRNASKCEKTIQEIKNRYPDSIGTLEIGILDTSDLDSVAEFAKNFLAHHTELHAIVNNAGIHYISTEGSPIQNFNIPMKSKQGYDLAFATNYLGHFLLTELLAPILTKSSSYGTIVNVASSYHFLGEGKMLTPKSGEGIESMPIAARSDISNNYIHRELSYGNNKLAQVLHAIELQKRFSASKSNVRIVSVCTGFVDTNILPDNIIGKIAGSLAFRVEEGILSTMFGLFDKNLEGGEFLGNSINFWARQTAVLNFADTWKVKGPLCSVLAGWILLFQKMSYGKCNVEPSSPDSMNVELAKSFYDWSKAEVSPYLR